MCGEMIKQTTIKCPNCNTEVDHLELWKKVEGKYFHLCEKCINDNFFQQDALLLIGYVHGFEMAIRVAIELIVKMREKI